MVPIHVEFQRLHPVRREVSSKGQLLNLEQVEQRALFTLPGSMREPTPSTNPIASKPYHNRNIRLHVCILSILNTVL
jgi:hypothetical protein